MSDKSSNWQKQACLVVSMLEPKSFRSKCSFLVVSKVTPICVSYITSVQLVCTSCDSQASACLKGTFHSSDSVTARVKSIFCLLYA